MIENLKFGYGDSEGKEKIMLFVENGIHYTFMRKAGEGIIDIHKTNNYGKTPKEKHIPILKIKLFRALRLIIRFNEALIPLLQKYYFSDRINIGKLNHHNLILFPLTSDVNDAQKYFKQVKKKQAKFKNATEMATSFVNDLILPQEIDIENATSWNVYSTKKGILKYQGIIYKHRLDKRTKSFYFISKKKFALFKRESQKILFDLISKTEFESKEQILQIFNKNNNYIFTNSR